MSTLRQPGVGIGVVILNSEGKILLGKRHTDQSSKAEKFNAGGAWTCPGGKQEFGETMEQCAIRETQEECGITPKSLEFFAINEDMNDTVHFITIGFICREFDGKPQVLEPNEITEWAWFDLDNLPDNLYGPTEKYLRNLKMGKSYL